MREDRANARTVLNVRVVNSKRRVGHADLPARSELFCITMTVDSSLFEMLFVNCFHSASVMLSRTELSVIVLAVNMIHASE